MEYLYEINKYLLPFFIAFLGILIYKRHKSRFFDYILALLIAPAVSEGIKYIANVPRPQSVYIFEGSSFPSTHTTIAFTAAFFYFLACHTLSKIGKGSEKIKVDLMLTIVFLTALLIGFLRMMIGAHHFLDVFIGTLVGLAVALPFKYYDVSGRRLK